MPRNRQRTTSKAAWIEKDLQSAKTAIEGGLSKRKAAKQYNIPFTTLRIRLKNENMTNPSLGRKPVFNQQQETEIAEQVKLLGSLYYGRDVLNLRKLVYRYAEFNNINNNFDRSSKTAGLDWIHAFMRRNPSVSLRKAEATSINRSSTFNKVEISEQTTENQDPNVQNLEDPQPYGIAIISGHTCPLPCSSNKDQRSESVLGVASNHQELIDEQRTPVAFAAIATTPTIEPSSKPGQRKRKQHAAILTSTPMKIILEEKQKKKIAKLNKTGKGDKSKPKQVVKEKKNKHMKQKSYKRKILQESSSESEDEEHLCDDDSDDEMNVDDENYNKCIICEEFGKNNEMWYRCTFCGLWAHAICSGWDSPDGYICDLCLQK